MPAPIREFRSREETRVLLYMSITINIIAHPCNYPSLISYQTSIQQGHSIVSDGDSGSSNEQNMEGGVEVCHHN